jgi:glutamyl-tRNA reductase
MPGGAAGTGMRLFVVGTNYRTGSLELREQCALLESDLPAALEELRHAGLGEGVLIATCDRIELVSGDPAAGARLAALLARRSGQPALALRGLLYQHEDGAALRHLLAVACALDSHVIGEPQVLGQVKAAHRAAVEAGLVDGGLDAAFGAAFAAARRVRRETRIAECPVSIAAAAVQFARDIHGDLDGCAALLLGPGEMGELLAEHFHQAGLAQLVICGPPARARRAAQRFASNVLPLEALDEALTRADIVIASLGSGHCVLTAPRIAAALRRRPRRPIFVIDAAIPADAEPAVNDLDGAFLYDLDDLERAAMAGRATREAASLDAWRIVDAELATLQRRRAERLAVPAVVALRAHFERVRAEVLLTASGDAEAATRLLVNRLLHDPSEVLRGLAGGTAGDIAALEDLMRRLFRLGSDEPGGEEERTE